MMMIDTQGCRRGMRINVLDILSLEPGLLQGGKHAPCSTTPCLVGCGHVVGVACIQFFTLIPSHYIITAFTQMSIDHKLDSSMTVLIT